MAIVQNADRRYPGLKIIIITQGISPIVRPIISSQHKLIGIIDAAQRHPSKKTMTTHLRTLLHFLYSIPRRKEENLKKFSEKHAIAYYYMDKGSSYDLESWILNLKPDLIVVYSMTQLLKENIFTIPPYGTINLHPSYLPKYRGPNPWIWQYITMDLVGGFTVHYIDNGEDTGDIILQKEFPIARGGAFNTVFGKSVHEIGVPLLLNAIDVISARTAPRIHQPKISPTQRARSFLKGEEKEIIDWENWDVERVWHLLRGFSDQKNFLKNPLKKNPFFKWIIGDYIRCDTARYRKGGLLQEPGSYFIACSNGKIFLQRTLKFPITLF
jgi:methionyl-tRNA formyltransferase